MSKAVDVIHIGYPKTGTTYIQSILDKPEYFMPVGKPAVRQELRKLADSIISTPVFEYDANSIKYDFIDAINRFKSSERGSKYHPDCTTILSHELLTGDLFFGKDASLIADRLVSTFDGAHIIITIREQVSMVESLYRYYIRGGGSLPIQDFLYKVNSPAVDVFGESSIFTKFCYHNIIRYYQSLFGKKNVSVIPYELLKNNKEAFVKSFMAACNKEISINEAKLLTPSKASNVSFSSSTININRFLNKFITTPNEAGVLGNEIAYYSYLRIFPNFFKKINMVTALSTNHKFTDKKPGKSSIRFAYKILKNKTPKRLSEKYKLDTDNTIADEIRLSYKESNSKTEELTGLDLNNLGYYT